MIKTIFLFAAVLGMSTCSEKDEAFDEKLEIPACITQKIVEIQNEDVWNPPAKVYQYKYQGQTVYFIPQRCCDIRSILMDEDCNVLCYPDGGITGNGDGNCSDFFDLRSDEKLIWEDTRK